MPHRFRCLLAVLALLSSPAGWAAGYPIHISATAPYHTAMLRAAQQIAAQPGFTQRYPPSRYMLSGVVYAWTSPANGCYVAAGFSMIDIRNESDGVSGDFAYVDTHDLPCPNAYTIGVVPDAQQIATKIFLGL